MEFLEYDTGDTGETIGANILATILNAKTYPSSYKDEATGALDYSVKYKPNFISSKPNLSFEMQVKAGDSWGDWLSTRNEWRLDVKKEHIQKWKNNNSPVVLLWVNPNDSSEYWKYIGNNSSEENIYITPRQIVTPAALFELTRLIQLDKHNIIRLSRLVLTPYNNRLQAFAGARSKFNSLKREYETILGKVTVSNYAWRHLTRNSRKTQYVLESLLLLTQLDKFLTLVPDKVITLPNYFSKEGAGNCTERRKVFFIYRKLRFSDTENRSLIIRLDEVTTYPLNWKYTNLAGQKIFHSLKLESIYRRK